MFSKKKFILISKINILFLILLILIKFLPVTFSKYQSSGIGNVDTSIAFYLLEVGKLNESIKISDLVPRSEPYIYTFTISNQKESKISDVDIEYILKIRTTTNLPLQYKLYLNSDYQDSSSINLINDNNSVIEKDDDGTYFQEFTFTSEKLYFSTPKVNTYTLLIYFNETEEDATYQGNIELVELNVDSSKIMDN